MSAVIFVEGARHAEMLRERWRDVRGTQVVALTAEAWWALEQHGVACAPVCNYSNARALATPGKAYAAERCTELASVLDGYFRVHSDLVRSMGLQVGTDQWYRIFSTIESVLTRAYHARNVLLTLRPRRALIFNTPTSRRQREFGFEHTNPLVKVLPSVCKSLGVSLEIVDGPSLKAEAEAAGGTCAGIVGRVRGIVRWLRSAAASRRSRRPRMKGCRLLFVGGATGYDWAPVIESLLKTSGCELWRWSIRPGPVLREPFDQAVRSLRGGHVVELPTKATASEEDSLTVEELEKVFAGWFCEDGQYRTLDVLGIDLMPALVEALRENCTAGVIAMLKASVQSGACLETIAPDAVCFFGITSGLWVQVARQCWAQGIPVVTFQHGGIYGSHAVPYHLESDGKWSDVFLCYGQSVADYFEAYRVSVEGRRGEYHARSIAVGSTRVERMRLREQHAHRFRRGRRFRVLFVSEFPNENLVHGHELEDTLRYRHQRAVVDWFSAKPSVDFVFRPFPLSGYRDPVVKYLHGLRRPNLSVDGASPLESLIERADVVLTDTTGTTWGEALGLSKLLVIWHDAEQALMTPAAMAAIGKSAIFCETEGEFFDTLESLLTGDPWENCRRRKGGLTDQFLLDYVLHKDDGRCVERAIGALRDTIAAARQRT